MRRPFLAALGILAGCATIPSTAFDVAPALEARREVESRRFEGLGEDAVLAAAVRALEGQGFTVTQREDRLGLVVAQRVRFVEKPWKAALDISIAVLALASGTPYAGSAGGWSEWQRLRANVIVEPGSQARSCDVRAGFQGVVGNPGSGTDDTFRSRRVDPEAWPEFFAAMALAIAPDVAEPAPEDPAVPPIVQAIRPLLPMLLDRGFLVDQVDLAAGTVVASKFLDHRLRITLTVRPGEGGAASLAAAVEFNGKPVDDPKVLERLEESLGGEVPGR